MEGAFELPEGYEALKTVYLEVVRLENEDKKIVVFNCNVKEGNVKRLGTKLSYHVQLDAPAQAGDYQVRVRAQTESAGEARFRVKG